MPSFPLLTTKKAVLSEFVKQYMDRKPNVPMYQQFAELKKVYGEYQKNKSDATLHYLFALCLRILHGNRIPWINTRQAVDALEESGILGHKFSDFEELHAEVKSILSGIHFAEGPLMVYDTALCIGTLLDVWPEKHVYLYAGAWNGAVCLKDRKDISNVMLTKEWQKPDLFSGIDSVDIEDILCHLDWLFNKLQKNRAVSMDDIDKRLKVENIPPFSEEALKKMGYLL